MKTQELRIGNIILCNGKPEVITGVLQYGVYFAFGYCPNVKGLLQPVALKKDWFLDFKFEKKYSEYHQKYYWQKDKLKIYFRDQGDGTYTPCTNPEFLYSEGVRIDSVHHLQNIYMDLCGVQLVSQ